VHTDSYTKKVGELLAHASITPNGDQPWDIQVHNPELFKRVIGRIRAFN